jgi:hypothetical protein
MIFRRILARPPKKGLSEFYQNENIYYAKMGVKRNLKLFCIGSSPIGLVYLFSLFFGSQVEVFDEPFK